MYGIVPPDPYAAGEKDKEGIEASPLYPKKVE
jgi:hypothetical protein